MFLLPIVLSLAAVALVSEEQNRNGNLGTLLIGFIPYVAAFLFGESAAGDPRAK